MPSPVLTSVDWDGDGDEDLIISVNHIRKILYGFKGQPVEEYISGDNIYTPVDKKSDPHACRVYLLRNLSTAKDVVFDHPQEIKADGKTLNAFAYAYPAAFKVPGDSKPKLLLGDHNPHTRSHGDRYQNRQQCRRE